MTGWWKRFARLANPEIPEEIKGEFVPLVAVRMQAQARLLFLALLITTPTAFIIAAPNASNWTRFGAPVAMALFCLAGFASLSRKRMLAGSLRRSAKFIREATVVSSLIAVLCSTWCVMSWLGAPPHERIYYPVIIALGAFSTAYCLSSARIAALLNLAICLIPMLILLFTSDNPMDLAIAVSLTLTAVFQMHMIGAHHSGMVEQLSLQRSTRELAQSDPLTGLLNRRALIDNALDLGNQGPLRLILADIDHFKAVNDGFGHDVGDLVLREVAQKLAMRAEIMGSVARIGGEEFAILGLADELPEGLALGILADIRSASLPHGGSVTVSLGQSDGLVTSEEDWRRLYQQADRALYQAKREGRNRAVDFCNLVVDPDIASGLSAAA